MVADGDPLENQFAMLLADADERQIGRSTPHVTDEEPVGDLEHPPPALGICRQPRVDGRLRFFEQDHVLGQPGGQGGLTGQFAGAGVERCRHGEHYALLGQGGLRKRRLPGGRQMR